MSDPSFPIEMFEPLVREPRKAGLFSDFDGTLSPIVSDPGTALLLDGTRDILSDLADRLAVVAVLSGRTCDFVAPQLPSNVTVAGLYGLEKIVNGERDDHPLGGAWREVTDDIAGLAAERGPQGMRVEDKGLSVTLHYREHPEIEADVRRFAEQQSARSGLVLRTARMSFELHPPIDADKGTAITDLAEGLGSVLFMGDDQGDLSAFDALDALAAQGVYTVRVVVDSAELPAELRERADLVVDGPEGALEVLRHLHRAFGFKSVAS